MEVGHDAGSADLRLLWRSAVLAAVTQKTSRSRGGPAAASRRGASAFCGNRVANVDWRAYLCVMNETGAHHHLFDTAIGTCGVAWNARGLCGVQLPDKDRAAT